MRIVIIGGSGHVGTYLVPRLVEAGHEVINVSRQARTPYQAHGAWKQGATSRDRSHLPPKRTARSARRSRRWQPDAVIDMICFTLASAQHLVAALRGKVRHFLHCGTIWIHGQASSCRPSRRSRAARSASTASRKQPSKRTCWRRRSAATSRRRRCIRGTSSGRAGRR
jgi:uncharacterized protein YbjT (DUF2867 family)